MATSKKLLKDKKIEIQRYEETYIPGQGQTSEWVNIHEGKLWAYYRHLSGNEIFAAAQVAHIEEVLFVINWRNDVKPGQKILYNNNEYEITRVDDFEGYKKDLKLYAKNKEA
jgi:SPP1 family predicted phage head-tail adaptor